MLEIIRSAAEEAALGSYLNRSSVLNRARVSLCENSLRRTARVSKRIPVFSFRPRVSTHHRRVIFDGADAFRSRDRQEAHSKADIPSKRPAFHLVPERG
jgi:hypothetical protein